MTAHVLRVLLVVVVAGSGFTNLWAQSSPSQPPSSERGVGPISAGNVIVLVPRSRDAVLAYSNTTGRWAKQPIKVAPATPIIPILGDTVAAFQIGPKVFAFSADTGGWKSVSVSDPKVTPVIDSHCVTIQSNDKFYVFSSRTGQWSSVDLENGSIDSNAK